MRHYGDITKLNGADMPVVDAIFGGSPCQDLSVAGKRAGLAGERSGLFMEQLRIVKEMRAHDRANGRTGRAIRPRYMVWENVPGAFSSNDGKDFQAVLTEICKVVCPSCPDVPMPDKGGWPHCGLLYGMGKDGVPFSVAWNIHDAQYWGVPQRRRRICALADYGGLSAGDILFDPQLRGETEGSEPDKVERDFSGYRPGEIQPFSESVQGDLEPGAETGQGTSEGTERRSDGTISFQERAGKPGGARESSFSMNTQERCQPSTTNPSLITANPWDSQSERVYHGDGAWHSLNANESGGQSRDAVLTPVVYGISSDASNAMLSSNPNSGIYKADTSRTLDNNGGNPACNQGGMMVVASVDARNFRENAEVNGTLQAKSNGGYNLNSNNIVRTAPSAIKNP